jgi:NAD(P)H-flavin reductase
MTNALDPMVPAPYRIQRMRRELRDTFTVDLAPVDGSPEKTFLPGQFNMLYVFGVGEVPISISGNPDSGLPFLVHTVRSVGPVTNAMANLKRGDTLGVRGPFGSIWPVATAEGADVVIIAGGVGLAPLRPAIYHVLANREKYGEVCIYYGARTPQDILFINELQKWRGRFDVTVDVTVDCATRDWAGKVGVVTNLVGQGYFDPFETVALVCGPEVMMRYTVKTLNQRGVSNDHIYLSTERNMKCALGFCGHCQFGPYFVCKDGPVFRFDHIEHLFEIREL